MKKNLISRLLVLTLCLIFALAACTTAPTDGGTTATNPAGAGTAGDGGAVAGENPSGVMTDVGTPRSQTLVVDTLSGRQANPDAWNPYIPGCVNADIGLHQLVFSNLWEINTVTGEQYGDIAETFPEEVGENTYQFKIRQNLKWSDGVDLTAEDVAFTFNMLLGNSELPWSAAVATIVKSCRAVDSHTVELVTHAPQPKLSQHFGVTIFGNNLKPVPKHIWEKENPATFLFSDPVSSGPYVLSDRDPQGYWFLYEKRADWQNSPVGQTVGEPAPQYILFKSYGAEEKRIMAAIQNEIDVLQDITPESWDILREKNEYAHAWYPSFPYADMNDPCERGMGFNCSNEYYNNKNVRWALALSTDIKSVSMATFGGMLRVSPLQVPPTDVLMDTYHKTMTPWLREFALDDGYKPFDENYAKDIVEILKQQGIEGLPGTEQEMIDVFGVGWWKYDIDQAAKMLEAEGFTKKDGKWYTPDGNLWEVSILAPADFEIQSMRLAFAVADSWNKSGVTTTVVQQDAATFWNNEGTGNFDVGSYWPACGIIPDTSTNMDHWRNTYIRPNGETPPGNRYRWDNQTVTDLLAELSSVPSEDTDKIIAGITEINKQFVAEQPFIAMFGTSKFVPVTTYYWEGFQHVDNQFEGPWWWWSQFKYYLPHLKPSGR